MFKSKASKADKGPKPQPVFKQNYFTDCHRTYSCIHCRAHLANHDELISKLFQGNHGRAYLFNKVVNIGCKQAVQRELLTGLHAVADIYCDNCETTLGWKYEQAFAPSQKYKEGKYIIELVHMLKENNWDLTSYNTKELLEETTKRKSRQKSKMLNDLRIGRTPYVGSASRYDFNSTLDGDKSNMENNHHDMLARRALSLDLSHTLEEVGSSNTFSIVEPNVVTTTIKDHALGLRRLTNVDNHNQIVEMFGNRQPHIQELSSTGDETIANVPNQIKQNQRSSQDGDSETIRQQNFSRNGSSGCIEVDVAQE